MRLLANNGVADLPITKWEHRLLSTNESMAIPLADDATLYYRSDQPLQVSAKLPTGSIGSEQYFAPYTWMSSMIVLRNAKDVVVANTRPYPIRVYIGT